MNQIQRNEEKQTNEIERSMKWIRLLLRERESDSMSLRWKRDEKQAAQHPNRDRQRREELLGFFGGIRDETLDHVLVKQRDRDENNNGQQRVEEIDESQPVFVLLPRRNAGAPVHDPQPAKRGQPIPDFAPLVPETVGEAEEEAGNPAEGD